MGSEALKRLNDYRSRIKTLPSLPRVVEIALDAIDNPLTSTSQLEKIILEDPGLSEKIIRLAGSDYYHLPGTVNTLDKIINHLGFESMRELLFIASFFNMFYIPPRPEFDLEDFWNHSAAVGAGAEFLANELQIEKSANVFLCGLIHDIGKLVLAHFDFANFVTSCRSALENGINLDETEKQFEFQSHSYWGNVIADRWYLPLTIQSAIKDHHVEKEKYRITSIKSINRVVDVVFISNQLAHLLCYGFSGHQHKSGLNAEVLARLGLTESRLEKLIEPIEERMDASQSLVDALFRV